MIKHLLTGKASSYGAAHICHLFYICYSTDRNWRLRLEGESLLLILPVLYPTNLLIFLTLFGARWGDDHLILTKINVILLGSKILGWKLNDNFYWDLIWVWFFFFFFFSKYKNWRASRVAELTKARLSKGLVVGSNPLWHAYKRVGPSSSSRDMRFTDSCTPQSLAL